MTGFVLHLVALLVLPPLFVGVLQKTKAWFAGRQGAPLLQPYFDLGRLLRKGSVYSHTTTWIFRSGPIIGLASTLTAGLIVPLVDARAPLAFFGDVIAFAYLLGLGRFFTMAAALDTGSSFEGMGASREAAFSALIEPGLFCILAAMCLSGGVASLGPAFSSLHVPGGVPHPAVVITATALVIVLLAENSRIPVDDPATHLELTMIHEVMVLDHAGPDLAFILYGSAVKLFVIGAMLVHLVIPVSAAGGGTGLAVLMAGESAVAVLVAVVESAMARLRMRRVPQFVIGASVLGAIGLLILFFRGRA